MNRWAMLGGTAKVKAAVLGGAFAAGQSINYAAGDSSASIRHVLQRPTFSVKESAEDAIVEGKLHEKTDEDEFVHVENDSNNSENASLASSISSLDSLFSPELRALALNPPSELEVNSAVDSLKEHPEILSKSIPFFHGINPRVFDLAMESVREIVMDPVLVSSVMLKKSAAQEQKDFLEDESPHSNPGLFDPVQISVCNGLWEELAARFHCSICLDVLAAPHVLSCSHSFCWTCVKKWDDSCTYEDAELVHVCPMCQTVCEDPPTFERMMDELIVAQVETVPDCSQKAEWSSKRREYLRSPKRTMKTRSSGRAPINGEADEEDWFGQWNEIKSWALPLLSVVVMILIATTRR